MTDIAQIVSEFRKEADIDFIDLPFIASAAEYDLGAKEQKEMCRYALDIVEKLMALGVHPGDYSFEDHSFRFWPGTEADHLKRIEAEWTAMGKTPNLGQPICWFALRPSDAGEHVWTDGTWSTVG